MTGPVFQDPNYTPTNFYGQPQMGPDGSQLPLQYLMQCDSCIGLVLNDQVDGHSSWHRKLFRSIGAHTGV